MNEGLISACQHSFKIKTLIYRLSIDVEIIEYCITIGDISVSFKFAVGLKFDPESGV